MKASSSTYIQVRGLKYHCRLWGPADGPKLFLLHGIQDASASWQFTVDALKQDWRVIAPDWRGFGLTAWSGQDTYWTPDLLADLSCILNHFEPARPVSIMGHSLGGSMASILAGTRKTRIAKLVNIEGLGPPTTKPGDVVQLYEKWLDQIEADKKATYAESFEKIAERMVARNGRIPYERALFLARHLYRETEKGIVPRADPAHRTVRPVLFRVDEAMACWGSIETDMLWVEGAESRDMADLRAFQDGYDLRLSAFRALRGIERIKDAGHNVHLEQPERLAEVVERFLLAPGLAPST